MGRSVSRREFVKAGAAVSVAAAAPKAVAGPTVLTRKATPPVVIASANGHAFKNGGPRTCVAEAFERITGGEDVLDALIAGVNIVELDPEESGVGYGGLPNADGVVQLDSCCMHGPKKRAGGVAALEGVRTPSLVARAVMDADRPPPAGGHGGPGFRPADGLRDRGRPQHRPLPVPSGWSGSGASTPGTGSTPRSARRAGEEASRAMVAEGLLDPESRLGTINCDGVGPTGDVCGVTTTSGLAFKIPGRVGDSPILGAGLWLDGEVGVAGLDGPRRGQPLRSVLVTSSSSRCARAAAPKDAAMEALRRVKANTVEKRLLTAERRAPPSGSASTWSAGPASTPGPRCGARRAASRSSSRSAPRTARSFSLASRCSETRPRPETRRSREEGRPRTDAPSPEVRSAQRIRRMPDLRHRVPPVASRRARSLPSTPWRPSWIRTKPSSPPPGSPPLPVPPGALHVGPGNRVAGLVVDLGAGVVSRHPRSLRPVAERPRAVDRHEPVVRRNEHPREADPIVTMTLHLHRRGLTRGRGARRPTVIPWTPGVDASSLLSGSVSPFSARASSWGLAGWPTSKRRDPRVGGRPPARRGEDLVAGRRS